MNVLVFSFYATGVLYALMYDSRIIYLYSFWIGLYMLIRLFHFPGRDGSIRKRLQLALWSAPSEGIVHGTIDVDLSNINKYLESTEAKNNKVTLTHVAVKAVGQGLLAGKDSLNGKITFGKFIPYDTIDVTCLVDVQGGKDLAALLVERVDKKTFIEIAQYLQSRTPKVRSEQDVEHKKRTQSFKALPPFLINIALELGSFISYGLGFDVTPLAVKKHGFGAATVTSLGGLGYKDVSAPLTPNFRNSMICSVNQAVDRPIAKNGQIVIAPTLKLNFCIDHRFVDGAKAKAIMVAIEDVFENPQKYAMQQ